MTIGRIPSVEGGIQPTIVDAKGDLIAATAADTVNRLAVGSNDQVLVADSSTSTGLKWAAPSQFSNPVLNSAMQIWQRGTSVAGATGVGSGFAADRWQGGRSAFTSGQTTSRQLTNDTTNLPFIQYCARVQRDSGNTSTAPLNLTQSFESVNSIPYAGRTVTLSFYARAGANYSAASSIMNAVLATGTGTDQNYFSAGYTGSAVAINQNFTLTTTWQRFNASATLATNANELAIAFSSTPVGTAGTNDWLEITGVQLDVGSVALPFRTYAATLQGELAACQRYFSKSYPQATFADGATQAEGNAQGIAVTTSNCFTYVPFPVTMRVSPTVNVYAGAGGQGAGSVRDNSTGPVITGVTVVNSNTGIYQISKATAFTVGRGYGYEYTASAEL